MAGKVKILIVDDSPLVRQTLSGIYNADPRLTVVGIAGDPYKAIEFLKHTKPDVISLDIEMPRMDGLSFLKALMVKHPIPVVILSTLTEKGSKKALEAMALGAIEMVSKPKLHQKDELLDSKKYLCDIMFAASTARVRKLKTVEVKTAHTADALLNKPKANVSHATTDKLIAIGASTGGTIAIQEFCKP